MASPSQITARLLPYIPRAVSRPFMAAPPTLVVASTGRSGSTMLYAAVMRARNLEKMHGKLVAGDRIENHDTWNVAWTLASDPLLPGEVYKTHDYPAGLEHRPGVRALFVFGSASDNVKSVLHCMKTRGADWIADHFDHLKAPGQFDDILTTDALGIEAQMRAWIAFTGAPVLCLRYETLWKTLPRIRRFTTLGLHLPEREDRAAKEMDEDTRTRIAATYGALDAAIDRLPDAFVASPRMTAVFDGTA